MTNLPDRPTLRAATPDDAAAIAVIYAPFVRDTIVSFEIEAPSAEEMAARMAALAPVYPWLVAERAGAVLGYAYAGPHRARAAYGGSVDVSVYIAPAAHRQGIGRALYEALFARLAAGGYHMAFAGIALPNAASEGLHRALGFTPVGIYRAVGYKFGRHIDTVWYQRRV